MNPLIERLDSFLRGLPTVNGFCLAFSGGVDSSVLLDALCHMPAKNSCRVIHVNHGLQSEADQWVEHCKARCQHYGVNFESFKVDARAKPGESPEAAARQARYQLFARILEPNECLLTGQHQDDQAETVLLQLLRGSGPAGLSAMPELTQFAAGWMGRPWLNNSRSELLHYASTRQVQWIEDQSNQELDFDRNYLRAVVMPVLLKRWPAAAKTLARSAGLQAQVQTLQEEVAAEDLLRMQCQRQSGALSVTALQSLSNVRVRNVLRHWIAQHQLATPTAAQLEQILEILSSLSEASPWVCWPGGCVGRYRGSLYTYPEFDIPTDSSWLWQLEEPLNIPEIGLTLDLDDLKLAGIDCDRFSETLSIRFRTGGERIRLPGRKHRHKLKKLLQESEVPPWLRERLPLLFHGTELVAVLGIEPVIIADGWSIND